MANMHLITGYAGLEHIRSADEGALNAAVFGNIQAVLAKGNQLSASAISNNTVRVLDGDLIMQGRHIRLNENTYVELTIDSGEQGLKRNDLIVARYTKNATTGVEEVNLVVIKGTATDSEPSDPAYTVGAILNEGAALNDMPLYRVPLEGISMGDPVRLFTVFEVTLEDLKTLTGNFNGHKNDSTVHVTAAEKAAWNGKAEKATDITTTLSTTWTGTEAPFTQQVSIDGMTADKKIEVGLNDTLSTKEQREAARDASLFIAEQGAGFITIGCDNEAPTVEIPVLVRVVD